MIYDLIIIGAGTAGFAASLYASRWNLKTLIIGKNIGGTGVEAHLVENYLGIEKATGMELMEKFRKHAFGFGAKLKEDIVVDIEKKSGNFIVHTNKEKFEAKTVILATGMKHRRLEVKGEKELLGRGVSYCFVCDGVFFKGKTVAVVGGSDSAVTGALFLSEICKKVYVIYRKDRLRGESVNVKRLLSRKNVEPLYNSNVIEILGDKLVKGAKLDSGKELKLDGMFIEIGLVPVAVFTEELGIKTNEEGFIITDDWRATSISGIFAAGDVVANNKIKQYISAASDGATAALAAYNYIQKTKKD